MVLWHYYLHHCGMWTPFGTVQKKCENVEGKMETKGRRLLLPVHIERSTNLPQPIKFKDENLRCTQLAQPYH